MRERKPLTWDGPWQGEGSYEGSETVEQGTNTVTVPVLDRVRKGGADQWVLGQAQRGVGSSPNPGSCTLAFHQVERVASTQSIGSDGSLARIDAEGSPAHNPMGATTCDDHRG